MDYFRAMRVGAVTHPERRLRAGTGSQDRQTTADALRDAADRAGGRHSPVAARELEDITYTLCVMTGTAGIREAVTRADALLAQEQTAPAGRTTDPDGEKGRCLTV